MEGPLRLMRGPSSRVLVNRCDIYTALSTPQAGSSGGPTYTYPATPTYAGVPCTAQPVEYEQINDAQERVTQLVHWKLMFAELQVITSNDKIIHVDLRGVTHTIFVAADRDEAGRGAAFTVRGTERI